MLAYSRKEMWLAIGNELSVDRGSGLEELRPGKRGAGNCMQSINKEQKNLIL